MKTIKKILFPTDFSEMAQNAYQYALGVAEAFNANLEVLHVYRGDFGVPVPDTMGYKMLEAREEEARQHMDQFLQPKEQGTGVAVLPKIKITKRIERGLAGDVIVDIAKDENFDCIVMGTKGEHNLLETIFGSVTTSVLRMSQKPVLAIPEDAKFTGIKNMAYATDLSDHSKKVLNDALDLAKVNNAKLHCVHVNTSRLDDTIASEKLEEFNQTDNKNANFELYEIDSNTVVEGLEVFIDNKKVDWLIMFRPERGLFERLFHSSQTRKIVLHPSVPVWIFQEEPA